MSQSKIGSAAEVASNIAFGFTLNYFANLAIFPLFSMHISLADNFKMGLLFTLVSVARQWVVRRWFNGFKYKWATVQT